MSETTGEKKDLPITICPFAFFSPASADLDNFPRQREASDRYAECDEVSPLCTMRQSPMIMSVVRRCSSTEVTRTYFASVKYARFPQRKGNVLVEYFMKLPATVPPFLYFKS